MSSRLFRQLLAGAFLVVVVAVASVVPVPYVALLPGPVYNTLGEVDGKQLISISGAPTYPTEGQLDVTTVLEHGGPARPLSLIGALSGWVRPAVAVLPEQLLYPPGVPAEQIDQQNAEDMIDSQESATVAALRQAGVTVTTTVVVQEVSPDGPSAGVLEAGDVIESVNGVKVTDPDELRAAISKVAPGDDVRLLIDRSGDKQTVTVTTEPSPDDPDRPLIGVIPRVGYSSDVTVKIELDNVGGPSAGLMFALGIYDQLTPGALTGGRQVAGTGTMDVDGNVGAIGGIQQKMRAARDDGATVFMVPASNCSEAVAAAPSGLRLVKARTLKSATRSLESLEKAGDSAVLPAC